MDIRFIITDVLTLIVSTIFLFRNVKKLTGNMYCVIYLLFFVFYVFPLYLDYLVSFPDYSAQERYHGFTISYLDTYTRIIYDISILLIQYFMSKHVHKCQNNIVYAETTLATRNYYSFIVLGMCFPTLLTLIFPVDKFILFTFGWSELGVFANTSATNTIENFTYFAVLCTILLIVKQLESGKRGLMKIIICLLFLYFNMCLQGKRSIVFFSIVTFSILLLPGINTNEKIDERKTKKRLILLAIVGLLGVAIMLASTIYVKVTVRGWDGNDTMSMYTMTRIDFLKDDRVRFAIYSLLNQGKVSILDEVGQTVFPIITWFYPINSILAGHGIVYSSYQDYFSDALQSVVDVPFMTTSFFAELISNFSYFGIFFTYLLCYWSAKLAQKSVYPYRAIIVIIFLALQMYTTKYLAIFFEMCLFYSILYNYGNKKSR